jgi:uncharacterized protein
MLATLLGGALVVYLTACALMFTFQRALLSHPMARDPRVPVLTLHTPEATLAVSVREQAGPRALIYFGGNAEEVSGQLADLAGIFPEHSLYLLHYRGYGGSSGRPSEAALHADALALHDHVRGAHAEITVIGRSLGSGVAIRLARERPIARLVLVTPYESLLAVARRAYPWVPVGWLLRDRFESWRHAPHVTAPTTLIAAERDTLIPPAQASALATRFRPGIAGLTVLPGAGHNDLDGRPDYRALLAGGLTSG